MCGNCGHDSYSDAPQLPHMISVIPNYNHPKNFLYITMFTWTQSKQLSTSVRTKSWIAFLIGGPGMACIMYLRYFIVHLWRLNLPVFYTLTRFDGWLKLIGEWTNLRSYVVCLSNNIFGAMDCIYFLINTLTFCLAYNWNWIWCNAKEIYRNLI